MPSPHARAAGHAGEAGAREPEQRTAVEATCDTWLTVVKVAARAGRGGPPVPERILEQVFMPGKSIAVPDAIYERVQEVAAAEGTTVEQLAATAIERDLARRWLARVGREGDLRRDGLSDADVETLVERAIREFRART